MSRVSAPTSATTPANSTVTDVLVILTWVPPVLGTVQTWLLPVRKPANAIFCGHRARRAISAATSASEAAGRRRAVAT
jgi:hypothetical protein